MKQIPLHALHVSLGAKIVPFGGFEMPVRYSSDLEEHHTVRNGVGVFDVSHMGEFLVKGKGALAFIQKVSANDASVLIDGKVQYSYLPNEQGGVVDDLLVYRNGEDDYMLVVNASNIDKDWSWISQFKTDDVTLTNISDQTCLFAVQGPKAAATIQKLTDVPVGNLEYYTFTKGSLAGVDDIIISATGYTGAGGFEIYVGREHAAHVWAEIFKAGEEYGIKPIGLGARDTLRLEMGYCLYGNDIDDSTSPLEAGLGWVTKFSKDFVGSAVIRARKENGLQKKLVGIELVERGVPRPHYEITDADGVKIGEVTSGTQSPTLQKGVALGYVPVTSAKPGTEVYIKVRDKLIKARISKLPFVR
ncbi:glycine cleavage system aminomethyltransferase GcvT [Ravibacter arvi]|uniref:Aminomethyltransferase n=1 Tax=Ravibacter arvi TaxID=2051041 RepID=A0ABP8LRA3_9BACT